MNPFDQYRRLIDDVLEHDCGIYSGGMCSDCRRNYARAEALEKEFRNDPLWGQRSLQFA